MRRCQKHGDSLRTILFGEQSSLHRLQVLDGIEHGESFGGVRLDRRDRHQPAFVGAFRFPRAQPQVLRRPQFCCSCPHEDGNQHERGRDGKGDLQPFLVETREKTLQDETDAGLSCKMFAVEVCDFHDQRLAERANLFFRQALCEGLRAFFVDDESMQHLCEGCAQGETRCFLLAFVLAGGIDIDGQRDEQRFFEAILLCKRTCRQKKRREEEKEGKEESEEDEATWQKFLVQRAIPPSYNKISKKKMGITLWNLQGGIGKKIGKRSARKRTTLEGVCAKSAVSDDKARFVEMRNQPSNAAKSCVFVLLSTFSRTEGLKTEGLKRNEVAKRQQIVLETIRGLLKAG